jgi:thiol-disulfide isomerase/thioredoxin
MQRMAPPRSVGDGVPARRRLLGRAGAAACAMLLPWRLAAAAHVVRAWPPDRPVPPLEVTDLAGKPWRLEALAGQVVLLNFWATWCEPCRLEMPSLDAMAARRRGDGVAVAAINYRERADVVQRYLEHAPFRSPVLLDSDGDATFAWTPRVFPTTVIVGRSGHPVHVVVGELDWDSAEARALIDPLVGTPGRS